MRCLVIVMAFVLVSVADAGGRRGKRTRPTWQSVQSTNVTTITPESTTSVTTTTATTGSDDALDEVNRQRAARGLRAFLPDALLNQAARTCAKIRAQRHIHGHLSNDFAYAPPGAIVTATGCGALEPSWGFAACCVYDNYTYAGAAWVMGSDGRRYNHIFVR